jgi:DNA polymerase III subunit delta'
MKFSSIISHQAVKERLLAAGRENRVSHALLFLGPEGSGNLALAIAFAQYLNCENPSQNDSCGVCSSCVKTQKLVHPDIHHSFPVITSKKLDKPKSVDYIELWRSAVLDNPYLSFSDWMEEITTDNKQGKIFEQESGDISQRLSLKGVEGKYKIVIIWYAEKMNAVAANKLLKILEEPPDNTLFFLVAERYEELLLTIISRTQLIKVNRLTDAELAAAVHELHNVDKITARHIAHRSEGNYNEAKRIINNDTSFNELNQQFLGWMRHCLKLNVSGINEMSVEFNDHPREMQKVILQHALTIVRECMLINYADRSLVRLEGKDLDDISRFAPFVTINNAEEFITELNKAHFHLERNANVKLLFTDLSLRLADVLSSR